MQRRIAQDLENHPALLQADSTTLNFTQESISLPVFVYTASLGPITRGLVHVATSPGRRQILLVASQVPAACRFASTDMANNAIECVHPRLRE
jgi:hypothetical protein